MLGRGAAAACTGAATGAATGTAVGTGAAAGTGATGTEPAGAWPGVDVRLTFTCSVNSLHRGWVVIVYVSQGVDSGHSDTSTSQAVAVVS